MPAIPRLHLFELEDHPSFPALLRDGMTDYLRFVEQRAGVYKVATPRLQAALRRSGQERIIDLAAGGGGPIPELLEALAHEGITPQVTLTDYYPNTAAFARAQAVAPAQVDFVAASVDAAAVPAELTGLRTMFSALHHFRPEQVQAVLGDARGAGASVAFFDVADRRLVAILGMLIVPWVVLLVTPLLRPVSVPRLFLTYVIPVLPWAIAWDGFVSMLRGYTPEELLELARAADPEGRYQWEAGVDPTGVGPGRLTWIVGHPAPQA